MTEHGMDQVSEPSPSATGSSGEKERQSEIEREARRVAALSTVRSVPPSALLVRLAARLGIGVHDLIQGIPADTIRRTHYPVLEERLPDGRTIYRHSPVKGL